MKTLKPFLLLLIFALSACKEEANNAICADQPITDQTISVLPLGDSRVEGDVAADGHESYRYYLWKQFNEQSWDINFVGSRRDGRGYPNVGNACFDQDHEGTGGEVTEGLLATIESVRFDPTPQIALLGIGGNDLLDLMLPTRNGAGEHPEHHCTPASRLSGNNDLCRTNCSCPVRNNDGLLYTNFGYLPRGYFKSCCQHKYC